MLAAPIPFHLLEQAPKAGHSLKPVLSSVPLILAQKTQLAGTNGRKHAKGESSTSLDASDEAGGLRL